MAIVLVRAIYWFAQVLTVALIARAVLSWFAGNAYSPVGRIYHFFVTLTEPLVGPCRRLLYRFDINTGMFDLSVLMAFFLVEIVANLLVRLVMSIL